MSRVGLETLAEYGRALGIQPPVEEIKQKALMIFESRRGTNTAGTPESDWLLAETALYANLWVDSVLQKVPGKSCRPESIEEQTIKLAHAIRDRQPRIYQSDSPENWVWAAKMIRQRTFEGRVIVDHNLFNGF